MDEKATMWVKRTMVTPGNFWTQESNTLIRMTLRPPLLIALSILALGCLVYHRITPTSVTWGAHRDSGC